LFSVYDTYCDIKYWKSQAFERRSVATVSPVAPLDLKDERDSARQGGRVAEASCMLGSVAPIESQLRSVCFWGAPASDTKSGGREV